MSDVFTKPPIDVLTDLLFQALRHKNAVLNERAAIVLSRMAGEPARRLVREAARPKNGLAYRLRLLGVIERAGAVAPADDWLLLKTLAADKNPQIREAVRRCGVRCPAAGP